MCTKVIASITDFELKKNEIKYSVSKEQQIFQKFKDGKITFSQLVIKLNILPSFYYKICYFLFNKKDLYIRPNKKLTINEMMTFYENDIVGFTNIVTPFYSDYYEKIIERYCEDTFVKYSKIVFKFIYRYNYKTLNRNTTIKFIDISTDNKSFLEDPVKFYKSIRNDCSILIINNLIIKSDDIYSFEEHIILAKMYGIKIYVLEDILNHSEIDVKEFPKELDEGEYNRLLNDYPI